MGIIVIVSGPSGSGKGSTIVQALRLVPEFQFARSLTTREPRADDTSYGLKTYDYTDRPGFDAAVQEGRLLEWDEHHGHFYGSYRPSNDRPWLYEVDVHGAESIKAQLPEAKKVLIFPSDPMKFTLVSRMLKRAEAEGKEVDEADIARRADRAEYEVKFARKNHPDLIIINYNDRQSLSVMQLAQYLHSLL